MPTHTNPFPGMNPYFQDRWSGVHGALIQYVCETLSSELPDELSADTEESIAVVESGEIRRYRSDVSVSESWKDGFPPLWQPEQKDCAIAVTEPVVVYDEGLHQRHVEIRDRDGRLVTIIEVLSPANKTEDGAMRYRQKRDDFLNAGVTLVEIDLVRGPRHVVSVSPELLRFPAATCGLICVARHAIFGRREVYFCPLREPLPAIRVPLRRSDPDIPLALQPLIERIYNVGRWWLRDFSTDPHPPVADEDTEWVAERLRAAGLRQ